MSSIGIVGAGAFGTALGCALALSGRRVHLWGRDPDKIARMRSNRRNEDYLPDIPLPKDLHPTDNLVEVLGASVVLMVVPSQQLRRFLAAKHLDGVRVPIVLCAKGIERDTGKLQSQILAHYLPDAQAAAITGPGFAAEIAVGKPTALTLACSDEALGASLQQTLSTAKLRLYMTNDIVGAQLGGALKNVIAIACGLVVGAGLGESARAALMTRGFAEVTRLAQAMGAHERTLIGLSGFGDLVLTCTSEQSRNFSYGLQLGRSGAFAKGKTVEGIETALATCALAKAKDIDMPIAQAVADVLADRVTISEALATLMSRPLKTEV